MAFNDRLQTLLYRPVISTNLEITKEQNLFFSQDKSDLSVGTSLIWSLPYQVAVRGRGIRTFSYRRYHVLKAPVCSETLWLHVLFP